MATEKWIAGSGVGLTWTDAFSTATLNSIASGNAILSDLQIDNSSALDMFCDVSFALGSAVFPVNSFLGLFLYPLNKDGSTYGDGRFGSSAAGPPFSNYQVGYAGLVGATQAQEGMFTYPGMRTPIVMPPGKFKFVIYNSGVALAASGNTCQYRTYNRQVA
jgi:hypothetical protein